MIDQAASEWFAGPSALGCTFRYRFDEENAPRTLLVEAYVRNFLVGSADFTEPLPFGGPPESPYCNNVTVAEDFRGNGIATCMYILAERIYRRKLQNYWADDEYQSPAARAMWARRHRPFG